MTPSELARLQATFDADAPLTVGIEEELMLLEPGTLDLAPVSAEVLGRLEGDERFKGELPAAQLELITPPCATVPEAAKALAAGRHDLVAAAEGLARPAGAGAHPFTAPEGELSGDERYGFTREEYGPVASRQLVFGLHVHVRLSGAERALAVYNSLRSYLPALAALAANAPFHAGTDSGMASVRPLLAQLLPRQGVPPPFDSLRGLVEAWRFGARAGTFPEPRMWWWEMRLHPLLGTIEVRVPDQQTRVAESAAIAAVVHALVAELAERHDAGESLPVHPGWRIAENRWSAARHGLGGTLADLDTGEPEPTREHVRRLLETLAPAAARAGCEAELAAAAELSHAGGAEHRRADAALGGVRRVAAGLGEGFLA